MVLQKLGISEDKLRYLGAYYSETFDESDIVVTKNNIAINKSSISLNDSPSTTDTNLQAINLATGDLDGDGIDEIGFRDASDNLKYYDVQDDTTTDTGQQLFTLTFGDIDGDGDEEIVFRDKNGNLKYYDVGSGTTDTGQQTGEKLVADVDDDGVGEIVFLDSNNIKHYDVQDGTATDTGLNGTAIAVGDVNNDSVPEIVFQDANNNLKYYDVQDATTADTGQQSNFNFVTADVDDDSIPEIVYRDLSDNVKYYDVQDGKATDIGENASRVNAGDVNNDGIAEIIFIDASNNLKYYDVQDGGTTDTGLQSDFDTAVGDVNDDGISEIVFKDTSNNLKFYKTETKYSNGDALIRNTSGIPQALANYEKAFFETSPDGETVTVDVETKEPIVFEDFEDNDISISDPNWSGWTTDTSNLTAQQSTVISGSYTGKINSANQFVELNASRSSPKKIVRFDFSVQLDNKNGENNDKFTIQLEESGTALGSFQLQGDGDIYDGQKSVDTWSVNTTYHVSFRNIDYNSETYDLYINGSVVSTDVPFQDSVSAIDSIEMFNSTSQSGATVNAYIDDFAEDRYVPQKTNISDGADLSSLPTDKELAFRVNLSRTETSNNPTFDRLEWWWLRQYLIGGT